MSRNLTVLRLTPEALPPATGDTLDELASKRREAAGKIPQDDAAGADREPDRWTVRRVAANLSAAAHLLGSEKPCYAGEQYRIARTKLIQRFKRPLRLAVTSPGVGDGKSMSSVSLAVAMALSGEVRTLLIDADLRGASIHRILELPAEPGLADVLSGACSIQEAMLEITNMPGLFVLTASKTDANPTELFDSAAWRDLMGSARDDFAHIVVDGPPVDMVADSDLISAVCDGVVMVVRPDHTNRTLCFSALAKLKPKMAGMLINDVEDWFLWKKNTSHDYGYYRRHEKPGRRG